MHFPHKFWNGQKKTDNANLVVSLYDKSWDPITYCISIKRMTFSLRTRCPDLCCLTCHWSHWIHLFSCDRANPGSGPGSDPIQDPVQDQIQFRIRPKRARKSYRWQKQHQPYLKLEKISTRRWLAHPPKIPGCQKHQLISSHSIILFFHQLLSNEKRNKSLIPRKDNILSHI